MECCEILRGMKIGKELRKRLKTGKVDEDRMTNYEKEWTTRLECVDEAHTQIHDLTDTEAEIFLKSLESFANGGTKPACPELQKKVLECFKENSHDALSCMREVEAFTICVDESMHKNTRKSCPSKSKPSYTEKFHQLSA